MSFRIPMVTLFAAALIAQPAFARGGHSGGGGHFGGGAHFGSHFGGFAVRSHPFFVPRARVFVGASLLAAPFYYYAPPIVYAPPVYYPPMQPGFVPPASGYIEQQPAPSASAPDAGGPWWYYCAGQKSYYPYVRQCPGGWEKVPAEPPPS